MSAAMLLPLSSKQTAVGTSFSRNSCKFGRKKSRLETPANSARSASSIDYVDITPFRRTLSFENNVSTLCKKFPQVHRGLISSLLESTLNDPTKAACLIQQVTESSGCVNVSGGRLKRRERDWNDQMIDDGHSSPLMTTTDIDLGQAVEEDDILSVDDDDSAQSSRQTKNLKTNASLDDQRPLESPSSPCSKDSSDHSLDTSRLHQSDNGEASSNSDGTNFPLHGFTSSKEVPINLIDSLNKVIPVPKSRGNNIRLLARVVLSQFEKLNSLQSSQVLLIDENKKLKAELYAASEELKKVRELNRTLQYYLSASNPVSTTNLFSNSGNGNGNGFDFSNFNRDIY